MIKNILGVEFKYEEDKMYRLNKYTNEWTCCNNNKSNSKYIQIKINKKLYTLHRIIYKYFNEDWDMTYSKNNEIDHININSLDNRIENLRVVNRSQNSRNRNKLKNCSSKYKNVYRYNNKWRAWITINGKTKQLGYFDTEEEAYLVYKKEYDNLS